MVEVSPRTAQCSPHMLLKRKKRPPGQSRPPPASVRSSVDPAAAAAKILSPNDRNAAAPDDFA
ncbi:hypothetical protein [Methylocella sp.]|uniref:hypothetical protein n=1 Tax=Methylocella sp. TaxID=1978226 RepID=UPI0035B3C014